MTEYAHSQMGKHCPSHDQVTVTREWKRGEWNLPPRDQKRERLVVKATGKKGMKKKNKKNRALPQQQKIASSQATQDCCYRNKENRDPVDHWGELSLKC